jgi:hypothetical protein
LGVAQGVVGALESCALEADERLVERHEVELAADGLEVDDVVRGADPREAQRAEGV